MPEKTFTLQHVTRPFAAHATGLLPPDRGAYALLIRFRHRLCVPVAALGTVKLPSGDYLYIGSANGPGGLRARIARHLRGGKRPHWHVDHLAPGRNVAAVLAVPGGSECALVARALAIPGVAAPVAGFGSSDCRRCPAHLLSLPGDGAAVLEGMANRMRAVAAAHDT